jgi:hypothetical protein
VASEEIVFPARPFREVHQLVFLFQSWQLVLQEADLPPALQPLREIPKEMTASVGKVLRLARDQLESAQSDSEISLRFPATPDLEAVLEWAGARLQEVQGLPADPELDPTWAHALAAAAEMVAAAEKQGEPSREQA